MLAGLFLVDFLAGVSAWHIFLALLVDVYAASGIFSTSRFFTVLDSSFIP